MFNVSYRKVGAIRFLKVGRFNLSWSVSREYRPIGAKRAAPVTSYWPSDTAAHG